MIDRNRHGDIISPSDTDGQSRLKGIAYQRLVHGWHVDHLTEEEARAIRPDLTKTRVLQIKNPPHTRRQFTKEDYRRQSDGTLI